MKQEAEVRLKIALIQLTRQRGNSFMCWFTSTNQEL
jgi:hypothetical protein